MSERSGAGERQDEQKEVLIRDLRKKLKDKEDELQDTKMASTCGDCHRSEYLDFLVSNRTWNHVMTGTTDDGEGVGGVLCLECFDHRAREAGVEYRDEVVLFGTDCWMSATYEGGMP